MKKIYFASPLFSEMELMFNASVVAKIREAYPEIVVYLPQENGEINDKQAYADSLEIANGDNEQLLSSDLVIAILDGISVDVGVASEIGIAFAKGIPVIGVYTDSRQQGADNIKKINALKEVAENQFSYVNLYTVGLIKQNGVIVTNSNQAVEEIKNFI